VQKTSVYLPERLKLALSARAAATGRSEAEVVRAAVEAEVRAGPGPIADAPERAVPGRLVGVGVGPGHPDLLTVRAVNALRRANSVLAPATAPDAVGRAEAVVRQALPALVIHRVVFNMSPDASARHDAVEAVATTLAGHLERGEEVAFVTLGDPLTYSTFSSVAAAVRRLRPSSEVIQVPGIMAFQALAAETGTVLADEKTRLVVRTALEGEDLSAEMVDPDVTLVVYKGGRRLPEVAASAAAAGRGERAVAGELLGMPGARVGPLRDVAAHGPASYLATVIVPADPTHPERRAPGSPR